MGEEDTERVDGVVTAGARGSALYADALRARRVLQRLPAVIARGCDGLLDFVVLAFGAWTVVYHLCLVIGIGTIGALAAWAVALLASAWFAFRFSDDGPPIPEPSRTRSWSLGRLALLLLGFALLSVLAAAVYAFAGASWAVTWFLLFLAAAAGLVLTYLKTTGRLRFSVQGGKSRKAPGAFVALAWAVGLAVFSLFLVRPDADDTQYVHLSTWIAEHDEFPLRDTLFSDQVFPAIIYPPISSFEALIGSVAGLFGISAASATYLLVTPLATALSVLAIWRLLRNWRASMVGLALSTTMVFLLMAAQEHRTFGNLFVGRIWQGKVVFLAVLVPLLFVLLETYAKRPTLRQLLFLAAAGAAGVGLTSTGTFLVPLVAVGCLAPLALRSVAQAAAGIAATCAYPLGSLVVTAAVGSRRAGEDFASDIVTNEIARLVLGSGLFAFIAVAAVLVGPLLIPSRRAALMAASTVVLVTLLYTPPLPHLVWDLTGIGRVLWRGVWVIPVAVLVGAAATAVPSRVRSPIWRAAPAVLLCAVLVAWGSPVWDSGTVKSKPSWKRPPGSVPAAHRILNRSQAGDIVLAPQQVSQSVVIMSGDVTTVSPRVFYTLALDDEPDAHVDERLLLQSILEPELVRNVVGSDKRPSSDAEVARALDAVGVDIACAADRMPEALETLGAAGFSEPFRAGELTCVRAPA